jgi:DNA primase
MSVTDEIKSRLDIVDVISEYMPLRKSGSSYSGFCPFHPNTRSPAFAVFPGTQTWRCFGACSQGGDIFSFVMKKEGWEFRESLVHLADKAGVTLYEPSPAEKKKRDVEDRLIDLVSAAADYYHQLLLHAPQAENARKYVDSRGLSDETAETYAVGFALDSWDACRSHFTMQGYSDEELIGVGLLTVNEEKGTRYDRFRNRLMIPIRDAAGRVVGFGARTLDPDGLPKYLNSPQTKVFDKGRLLFGLDLAKREIRQNHQVVIVEGYMDVLQAWQSGYRNLVAQMGTSLTEAQLRLAKRYSKRFILALDADAAGTQATLRSLNVAREALDRESDVRFDARGLVRNEGRLKADIRVVTLPEGMDPDNIIRQDAEQWPVLIDAAKPIVAYVIDVVIADLDLEDPKSKTTAAEQLLPLINEVANGTEREHYLQLLARRLGVDVRVLHMMPGPKYRHKRSGLAVSGQEKNDEVSGSPQMAGLATALSGQVIATDVREANYLCQCWHSPKIIQKVDRQLVKTEQPPVSEDDFERAEDRALWRYLHSHSGRWSVVTADELWDSLNDEILRQRAQSLMDIYESIPVETDRWTDRLVMSILDWRWQKVIGLLKGVESLFRDAEIQVREELMGHYRQQLDQLVRQLSGISSAKAAMSVVGRRNAEVLAGNRRPKLRTE